jgi:hypothetical protein
MPKHLTNVHSKLDRILPRLSALDEQQATGQRQSDAQIRLMTQMLGEITRMSADVALMANEARREAKEAKERVIDMTAFDIQLMYS